MLFFRRFYKLCKQLPETMSHNELVNCGEEVEIHVRASDLPVFMQVIHDIKKEKQC